MDWVGLDWIGLKDWVGLTGIGMQGLDWIEGLDWIGLGAIVDISRGRMDNRQSAIFALLKSAIFALLNTNSLDWIGLECKESVSQSVSQ